MRKLCENIGGSGRYDQSVDGLRYSDVLDRRINVRFGAGIAVEHAGYNFFSGKCREGKRTNELLGGVGHNDLNANAAVLQQADNFGGFVCRDATANSKRNFHLASSSSR